MAEKSKKPSKKVSKKASTKKSAKKSSKKIVKKDTRKRPIKRGEYGKIGKEKKAMAAGLVKQGLSHKAVAEKLWQKYGGSIQSYITLLYRWFPTRKGSGKSKKAAPSKGKSKSLKKAASGKKSSPAKERKTAPKATGDDFEFE